MPDSTVADLQQTIAKLEHEGAALRQEIADLKQNLEGRTAERNEALEHQTATSNVLKVISRSIFDLQPVLDTVLEAAVRLCVADQGMIYQLTDGVFRTAAAFGVSAEYIDFIKRNPITPNRGTLTGRTALERGVVHIRDAADDPEYTWTASRQLGRFRTLLGVPLFRDGNVIGVIALGRSRVEPFSEREIELVRTFADQAVIAIENARLITETREALEQQTATSEVLGVINSSPGDLAPVFDAMLDKAMRLCDASGGALRAYEGGGVFRAAAMRGVSAEFIAATIESHPDPASGLGRIEHGELVVQIDDIADPADPRSQTRGRREMVELSGIRTSLWVALRKDETLLGTFVLYRNEVRPFTDKQIALVQNFAAQAVIAMENARLITETREALEQQTATAEVLQVINSSPGDLAPVFDAMLDRALRLCEADYGVLNDFAGELMRTVSARGEARIVDWLMERAPRRPGPGTTMDRIVGGEDVVQIADVTDDAVYRDGNPARRALAEIGGCRTMLSIALRKDERLLGAVTVYRQQVRLFTDKQIALLQNFAAQAVIAMENARLLGETREALEQQTATAEVLQVINSSPGDVAPVFDAMLERAMALCEADYGHIYTFEDGQFSPAAIKGNPEFVSYRQQRGAIRPQGDNVSPLGRLLAGESVIWSADIHQDQAYRTLPRFRELADTAGIRSMATVALRRDNTLEGGIVVYRRQVRPFSDKQIALLQTFAQQAVIAMENARLLSELRQRTEEVAELNRGLEERVADQVEELGRVGRLKRFLAPQLAELIVSQGDEKILESHRREIVVVFCDLRGYTAFTETAEPEEVLDFLREYHGALGPLVSQFEGTLDQFSGDGIMVFFNDPVPIPDAAERAVAMTVAMREAAGTLIADWRERGRDLGFGAGIAQGYATLGQIGFSERSGYTAIGTVCNVAARLCAEARDSQILLSQRVNVALKGTVATEQLGPLALRGLTQPVVAYNVPLAASHPALRVIEGGPQTV